jgi:hypothetical protein
VKTFFETIAGFGVTALIFIGVAIVYGLIMGDTADEVAPLIGWGIAILAISAVSYWISKGFPPYPQPTRVPSSDGQDFVAKENNRKVAEQLASGEGMLAVNARLWLKAHERDPSVPIFGVRPYWTPTGPGGSPQLLTTIGLSGVDARLDYVREATAYDTLLPIMANDPNSRVRDAVAARLR